MRSILLFIFVLLFSVHLKAQDAHFSQFYANPLYLNPAMTGVFEGQYRFNANYRQQWTKVLGDFPFNTYGASFDYRWNLYGNDYLAFGLNAIQDESGTAFFQQTKGNLSLAFHKQLSGNRTGDYAQYLIAGGQIGYVQNRINFDRLSYSEQFDQGNQVFNPTSPTGEPLLTNRISFLDFNAGLLWYALFGEQFNLYAGAALMHINQADYSFFESGEQLHRRYVAHFGGEIGLSQSTSLLPAYIFMKQASHLEHTIGGNLRFSNNGGYRELALRMGLWWRVVNGIENNFNSESIIVSTMFEWNRWLLGISYDFNNSSLQSSTNNGALELSLSYRHPEKRRYGKVKCPKF